MCLTRRFRSGDWGGDQGGTSAARRNRAAARTQGGCLSGRRQRAAPGNRFSPLAGRCSDVDDSDESDPPSPSAVPTTVPSPAPICFGAFLPPAFAPEELLRQPPVVRLPEQGLRSSRSPTSPALDGEEFPPLPRVAWGEKPQGAPSSTAAPSSSTTPADPPVTCVVQVGSVPVRLPAAAPPPQGSGGVSPLGFASAHGSWAVTQTVLRGPAHVDGPLLLPQPNAGREPLDARQLSQGQSGTVAMALEGTAPPSDSLAPPPPAYKWLWLPPRTLDPLLGFPASPCDIRRNRSRAKRLLLRSDPASGATLPLLSAMDRDRDRSYRGKRQLQLLP
nr:uncharacterized protein LOC127347008 [Lolium perenne]